MKELEEIFDESEPSARDTPTLGGFENEDSHPKTFKFKPDLWGGSKAENSPSYWSDARGMRNFLARAQVYQDWGFYYGCTNYFIDMVAMYKSGYQLEEIGVNVSHSGCKKNWTQNIIKINTIKQLVAIHVLNANVVTANFKQGSTGWLLWLWLLF